MFLFIIGLFIGGALGAVAAGLTASAKNGDKKDDDI